MAKGVIELYHVWLIYVLKIAFLSFLIFPRFFPTMVENLVSGH